MCTGNGWKRAAALLLSVGSLLYAGELTVRVHDIRNSRGTVHIGIFNTPDGFPKTGGELQGATVAVHGGVATASFEVPADGNYAVAVYHDENGNGIFDRNFLGIPKEGYGFSNDAPVFFGPPSFEAARFELRHRRHIEIGMRY